MASQERQKASFKKRHHITKPNTVMPESSLVLMKANAYNKMMKGKSIEGPYTLVQYSPDFKRAILQGGDQRQWSVSVARLAPYPDTSQASGKDPSRKVA